MYYGVVFFFFVCLELIGVLRSVIYSFHYLGSLCLLFLHIFFSVPPTSDTEVEVSNGLGGNLPLLGLTL